MVDADTIARGEGDEKGGRGENEGGVSKKEGVNKGRDFKIVLSASLLILVMMLTPTYCLKN